MPRPLNAHLRHAQFYKDKLGKSDDQYISGWDSTFVGLNLFDYEWENIRHGHEWAVENIASNNTATELCNSYSDVGAFCLDLRLNPNELINWHEAGIDAAKRLNDHVSESLHYGNLGLAFFAIGEFDKALECFQHQSRLSLENKSSDIDAIATGNLGSLYCELGEYEKSVQYLNKALEYFTTQKDLHYQAALLGNLGNIYIDLGSTYESPPYIDDLISQPNGEITYSRQSSKPIFLELKLVDQGKVNDAIISYRRCLEFSRQIGDYRNEGSALGNLGVAYYLLGDFDLSLEYLNEGLSIFSKIAFRRGQSILLGISGSALKKRNNFQAALDSHLEQLTIANSLDSRSKSMALFNLGDTYYQLGDRGRASMYFQQGISIVQDQIFRFPKVGFNLIASSKKRYEVNLILEQTKHYFEKAGFNVQSENLTKTGFVVSTSQWPNHKNYGHIFVQVFSGDLTADKVRHLYDESSKQGHTASQIAYAVYEDAVTYGAFIELGVFRLENNLNIVPLKYSVISESLSLQHDHLYRNLCAIEQEYISHSNPYGQSNAIIDPTLFFGRQRETDAIIKKLKAVEHVGIFGIRKIGKTSFLNHLKHCLRNEKIPVAYIGLQSKEYTPLRLFEDITRQFRDYIKSLGINDMPQSKLLVVTSDSRADQIFREEILELSQFAQKRTGTSLMVIMIDEVERIVPTDTNNPLAYIKFDEFFSPIRELSQTNHCLVSLVSGERATIRDEFPSGHSNTMFELYQPTYLPFFDYFECSDMVEKLGTLMGLKYTKESLDELYYETGGHPYISRMLCSCLAENLKIGTVSHLDVVDAIQPALELLNEYFKGWWRRATEIEKTIIKMMLRANYLSTINYDHQDALRTLYLHGIVTKSRENDYFIAPHLLYRWLLERGMGEHG